MEIETLLNGYNVRLRPEFYTDGKPAILAEEIGTGEIYSVLTTNLEDAPEEFVGIRSDELQYVDFLVDKGWLKDSKKRLELPTGFISILYYELSDEAKELFKTRKEDMFGE